MNTAITFPKLKHLKWVAPPCLTTFCKGSGSIEFPSLEELEVEGYHRKVRHDRRFYQVDDENAPHLFGGQKVKLSGLKLLSLKHYNMKNVWRYQVPLCFFQTLERLTLFRCYKMKEVFVRTGENEEGKTSVVTFPKLKVLWLCYLPRLTSLGKGIQSIELLMLEELKINGCKNLTSIASPMVRNKKSGGQEKEEKEESWRDRRCGITLFCDKKAKFRTLKRLEIYGCRNIGSVFSYSMIENLVQLNELSIKRCKRVKAVFAMQENEDKRRKNDVIKFRNLKRLELEGLESLCYMATMGEGTKQIEFPMLYDLKIKECVKLRSLVALPSKTESADEECILHDYEACPLLCEQKIKLSGLGSIEIYSCHNIKSVFSSALVESLTRLKHLDITDCEKMEKVIVGDNGMYENSVLLPSLEKLVLRRLELEMFCEWICPLEFPSLEDISVIDCSNLEVLTRGSIQTPKLNKMKVDDRRIKKELLKETKDLNSFLRQYNSLERQTTRVLPTDTDNIYQTTCVLPMDTEFSKYEPCVLPTDEEESSSGYTIYDELSGR